MPMNIKVTDRLYDRLLAQAEDRGVSISALAEELMVKQLDAPAPAAASSTKNWRNPDCEDCDGTGWAEHVSGSVIRCPTCSTITDRFKGDRRPDQSTWR